jgi:AcrR family transcriptional regulator
VPESRAPRADARRNRERVLAAAREAFAAEGPSVSLDDIARRAGVGPGTVYRHFPAKDDLFRAVIAGRLAELTQAARELAGAADPGAAFYAFIGQVTDAARANLALASTFADPADAGEAVLAAGASLRGALGELLARAQQHGAVRPDVSPDDLHAIIAGALVMEQRLSPASKGRGLSVVAGGLRPPPG